MKVLILLLCGLAAEGVLQPKVIHDVRALSRQPRAVSSGCLEMQNRAPEECRNAGLFDQDNIYQELFLNATAFVSAYCSETCGETVYEYYNECDKDDDTAALLDLLCAQNSDEKFCAYAVREDYFAENSTGSCVIELSPPCFDECSCSEECRTTLRNATDDGCCIYSFNSLMYSEYSTNASLKSCGLNIPGLCNGKFTNAPIEVPKSPFDGGNFSTNVSLECLRLLNSLPEECSFNISVLFPPDFIGFFEPRYCSEACAKPLYDVFTVCEFGPATIAYLDFSCAKNMKGTTCSQVFEEVDESEFKTFNDTCSIENICSSECTTILQTLSQEKGCCVESLLAVSNPFSYEFYQFCASDGTGLCTSSFTGNPIQLPFDSYYDDFIEDECKDLYEGLSMECQPVVGALGVLGVFSSPHQGLSHLCDGRCAKPIYKFYVECDKVTGNSSAIELDFVCASNKDGIDCINAFSSPAIESCEDAGPGNCSAQCSTDLEKANKEYGCCMYTLVSLLTENVTFAEESWSSCGVKNPGLCIGEFSGAPIKVDGEDSQGSTTGSAKTATASYILMIITCLLVVKSFIN